MIKYPSKKIIPLLICAITLSTCRIYTQPEALPNVHEQKTFRTGRFKFPENNPQNQPQHKNTPKQKKPRKIPEEVVQDIMHEYPEIAQRVKRLNDERAKGKFVPTNLVLVGKPGCGKTTIACALSQLLKREVAFYEGPDLLGDAYQNSCINCLEENLNEINRIVEQNPDIKYVIVIDEFMSLLNPKNHARDEYKDAALKLCYIMDRFQESDRIFFVVASDNIKNWPERLLSRFGVGNIIEVKPPSADSRRNIFLNHLGKDHSITEDELKKLVEFTNGMTYRQIEEIIDDAGWRSNKYNALKKAISKVKNISFVGRWVYDPINNRFVDPLNNQINDRIIEPFNKFCADNQYTIQGTRNLLSIACLLSATIYGFYFRKKIYARPVTHAKARKIQTRRLIYFGLLTVGFWLCLYDQI